MINSTTYRSLKESADQEFQKYLEREKVKKAVAKEREGGPNYYLLLAQKNGKLFTQAVIDAFHGGYIQPAQASSLLNTQITKFPKLLSQL